ncbi:MAG TPA: Gfo/Idh/MocA family oxidoreductase [Bryobacteraceae bacterium]|nr:Gfo/Idh/MocA family oxidoreductase [Bryobacteraceae bacterium]
MNRRSFLKNSATAAAFPYVAASTVRGANDRVEIGIIGLGGRAQWLIKHEDFGEARINAIADCFEPRLAEAAALHPEGAKWRKYPDARSMFDKEKLDAVFIETTTHARVLTAIQALQSGLDVYAEKPLTLTVEEGRVLVRAVRHYKRVLQTGTQQRSMPINIYASNLVSSGKIGKIEKVILCNFIGPARWKPMPAEPQPEGLNWDLWCGQTELRPYHSKLHRGWALWWDYDGGGQSWGVSGWGTHSLDQVQAALGTSLTGPVEIWPVEQGPQGKVAMRYANGTVVSLEQPKINDHQQLGAIFEGTNGRIQILRGDFITNVPELKKGAPDIIKEGPGENAFHIRNFVQAIKTRKQPNADVEIGHRSNSVCHLVNMCRDTGRKLRWDPKAERFNGDSEANAMLSRPRRKGYELPKIG